VTLDLVAIQGLQTRLAQNETVVVAIDPGLSGAVVRLDRGALRTRGKFVDHQDLANTVVLALTPSPNVIIVEDVHAMPGQGVSSMFSFGESYGVAKGAVMAFKKPVEIVAPTRWQNFFWKTATVAKARSRIPGNLDGKVEMEEFSSTEIASALWPSYVKTELMRSPRCKGPDHNICDAALIAAWRLLDTAPARFA
jgi:hypothetical protein